MANNGWTPENTERFITSLWTGLILTVFGILICAAIAFRYKPPSSREDDCWDKIDQHQMSLHDRYDCREILRELPNLPTAPE